MMFGRTSRKERADMICRLIELRHQAIHRAARGDKNARSAMQTYDSFLLYATIGKDRRKLGMEWAEKAEQQAKDLEEMFSVFAAR